MAYKRIIICADGTWNVPDQQENGKVCATNVLKMARAIRPTAPQDVPQVVYYHQGVGTNWGLDRILGGAFGIGLSRNIKDCYRFLVDNYSDGDDIYCFGFSRGAFTVRSLVGLIRKCGLMEKEHMERFPEAFHLYQKRLEKGGADSEEAKAFRKAYSREVEIAFMGVWDTVGALGIPGGPTRFFLSRSRFRFHDVRLSRSVRHAYHALSIDERRKPFTPTLWEQHPDATGQEMEQRWFAGVHSNVGGGYAETGLSDCAFAWMRSKAEQCGLVLNETYVNHTVRPNPLGAIRNSMSLLYRVFGPYRRPIRRSPTLNASVDQSAIDRLDGGVGYAPSNLRAYLARLKSSV